MAGSTLSLVIVGKDVPVYEAELGTKRQDSNHLHQFILHAALDNVDEAMWGTQSMFLKAVDRYYELYVSAWVTAGHTKFLLLHEPRSEDGIKAFFQEIHELYLRIVLNPFQTQTSRIKNPAFDLRVRAAARRYLQ